jgi:hypothetical protein
MSLAIKFFEIMKYSEFEKVLKNNGSVSSEDGWTLKVNASNMLEARSEDYKNFALFKNNKKGRKDAFEFFNPIKEL